MAAKPTVKVVKLKDDNYDQWRLHISLVLRAAKVWDIVNGAIPRPAANAEDWYQKDVEAQSVIVSTLDQKQTNHIAQCESSKEIFDRLERIHSDHSSLNKQHTLAEFLNFKMKPNQSLTEVYGAVEQLTRNLNKMGVTIDATTCITKIVSTLPDNPHKAFNQYCLFDLAFALSKHCLFELFLVIGT